nr:sigma factor-like helix-turn-helix DNA-binding protein [Armatimonas sp.]
MAAGCAEAQRCGVFVEDLQDFISEYLVGCWLSPNRVNLPLTCVCGANRARSFLRRERLWQQRVVLLEPEQLPSLVEAQKEAIALTPEGQVLLGELQSRIEVARGELSALQQQVFYLRRFEGLLFREIAVQTGQSIAAAKMAFRSGQHRLSAVFESVNLPYEEACEYLSGS